MITRKFSPTGVGSIGYKDSDVYFNVGTTPTTRVVSGGSSPAVSGDENVQRYAYAGTVTEGIIMADTNLGDAVGFTNLTPGIATLDESTKQLTRVASGTSVINAKSKGRVKQIRTPISTTASESIDVFESFVTGSLAKHCYDGIAALLAGKTAGDATQKFHATDGSRSTSIWANSIDLSCIITASNYAGGWNQGALIAPRFAVVATHVGGSIGSTCTVHTNAGVAVTRTVTAIIDLGGTISTSRDLLLLCFDSDFTGVTPAKLLPSNYGTKYRSISPARHGARKDVPVIKWKRGQDYVGIGIGGNSSLYIAGLSGPRPSEFSSWYVDYVGGDSGSPYGTIINGQFVFMGNAWSGGDTNDDAGSFLPDSYTELIAAMDSLVTGSSSTLSYVDLSSFPSY